MSRWKLPSGSIVQDDTPFVLGDVQYPGAGRLTADERTHFAIVEIVEQPMPDTRYGFASEDPASPGAWIFTPFGADMLKARLTAYAAGVRYTKETAGVTVGTSLVATDRGSQAMIAGAYNYVQANPSALINWKNPDGGFTQLTAAQITAIANAVGAYVQACFSAEAAVGAQIAAGTITTYDAVDAAFAAITV